MIQTTLAVGVVSAGLAFAAGWTLDHRLMQGRIDKEALERSRSAVTYIERNLERQAAEDRKAEAQRLRQAANLKEARRANEQAMQKPVECPPSGLVADIPMAGLAQRVRDIRAAGGGPAVPAAPAVRRP